MPYIKFHKNQTVFHIKEAEQKAGVSDKLRINANLLLWQHVDVIKEEVRQSVLGKKPETQSTLLFQGTSALMCELKTEQFHVSQPPWCDLVHQAPSITLKVPESKSEFRKNVLQVTQKKQGLRRFRTLTSTHVAVVMFKPSFARAAPDRNHPLPVSIAVKLYGDVDLLWVGDADSSGNDQGGALSPRHCFWEDGKILHHTGALFVEDPDREQRHAGAVVLKSQVEAVLGQWAEAPHLRVDLHQASVEVHLGEALIRRDGVHFEIRGLHPEGGAFGGDYGVRLVVVEVEGLLARAGHVGDGAAVAHGESDLHVDALRPAPIDEGGEEPVVLTGLEDVTHLVRPDGVEVFVVAAHLLPLWMEETRKDTHTD